MSMHHRQPFKGIAAWKLEVSTDSTSDPLNAGFPDPGFSEIPLFLACLCASVLASLSVSEPFSPKKGV